MRRERAGAGPEGDGGGGPGSPCPRGWPHWDLGVGGFGPRYWLEVLGLQRCLKIGAGGGGSGGDGPWQGRKRGAARGLHRTVCTPAWPSFPAKTQELATCTRTGIRFHKGA